MLLQSERKCLLLKLDRTWKKQIVFEVEGSEGGGQGQAAIGCQGEQVTAEVEADKS